MKFNVQESMNYPDIFNSINAVPRSTLDTVSTKTKDANVSLSEYLIPRMPR